jgi:hypothetical protein
MAAVEQPTGVGVEKESRPSPIDVHVALAHHACSTCPACSMCRSVSSLTICLTVYQVISAEVPVVVPAVRRKCWTRLATIPSAGEKR